MRPRGVFGESACEQVRIDCGAGHRAGRFRCRGCGSTACEQRLSSEAYQKLALSRQANEFDEGGHALKAQQLLEQVNAQLAMAAQFLNAHGK